MSPILPTHVKIEVLNGGLRGGHLCLCGFRLPETDVGINIRVTEIGIVRSCFFNRPAMPVLRRL